MNNETLENLAQTGADYAKNTEKMATEIHEPDLKELLEENLKYAKAIYWSVEKVRRHILWQRIFSLIYILVLFVIPLILAIIYLPPFMRSYLSPYMELLQSVNGK